MFDFPILSLLIWLPIAAGLMLVISNNFSNKISEYFTLIITFLIKRKLSIMIISMCTPNLYFVI